MGKASDIWLGEACGFIAETAGDLVCNEMRNERCSEDCEGVSADCAFRFIQKRTGVYENEGAMYDEFNPRFGRGDVVADCETGGTICILAVVSDQYAYRKYGEELDFYEFVDFVDHTFRKVGHVDI